MQALKGPECPLSHLSCELLRDESRQAMVTSAPGSPWLCFGALEEVSGCT